MKAFTTGHVPNCIKFHPAADKQHIFLAGMQNKKIVQFDMNSGEVVQEYNEHLGPVNTITFYDESRRFLTTSDDKAIRYAIHKVERTLIDLLVGVRSARHGEVYVCGAVAAGLKSQTSPIRRCIRCPPRQSIPIVRTCCIQRLSHVRSSARDDALVASAGWS